MKTCKAVPLAWQLRLHVQMAPFRLLVAGPCVFWGIYLWLNSVALYDYVCLSILYMDIWAVFSFWHIKNKLAMNTPVQVFLWTYVLIFPG